MVRKQWIALLAMCLVVGLLLPLVARAHHQDVVDPRDTKGLLDVRRVDSWGGHLRPGWKITTSARWSTARLWDEGYLLLFLDTFGTSRFDYYVLLRSDGIRMYAQLYRDFVNRRDKLIKNLRVWRRDARSVSFRMDLSMVRFPETRTTYGWIVKTLYTGPGCSYVCIDRAPDRGWVTVPARPEPTPTETEETTLP